MVARGESWKQALVEKIQEEIINYYGLLNELKLGAISKIPVKPEILVLIDTLDIYKMPIVSGGLMDQPALLMELIQVAKSTMVMMEHAQKASEQGTG